MRDTAVIFSLAMFLFIVIGEIDGAKEPVTEPHEAVVSAE